MRSVFDEAPLDQDDDLHDAAMRALFQGDGPPRDEPSVPPAIVAPRATALPAERPRLREQVGEARRSGPIPLVVSALVLAVSLGVTAAQIREHSAAARHEALAAPLRILPGAAIPGAAPPDRATSHEPASEPTSGSVPCLARPPTSDDTPKISPTEGKRLARSALEQGRFADAKHNAEIARDGDPADAEAWLLLGAAQQATPGLGSAHETFVACARVATRGPTGECRALAR